ncbi:phage holin, lambda family [Serratia marcescens]|uniref:phage holin, lambda family n=1 Tax=Serratia marcescens TaxID=615 RepID=UPI001EF0BF70|nr:phage holin, lambda family [Serratia marcescens]ULH10793.1 phage holin, lambda family [Serratia marcescens]
MNISVNTIDILLLWIYNHAQVLSGVGLAILISGLRAAYARSGWRRISLEAALCGTFAVTIMGGVNYVIAYFGLSDVSEIFIGGMIGIIGAGPIRAMILKRFEKNIDSRRKK